MKLKKVRIDILLPISIPSSTTMPNVVPATEQHLDEETPHEETNLQTFDIYEAQEIPLRRSQRERRSAILDDYMVYLQESDFDIGINKDPILFL